MRAPTGSAPPSPPGNERLTRSDTSGDPRRPPAPRMSGFAGGRRVVRSDRQVAVHVLQEEAEDVVAAVGHEQPVGLHLDELAVGARDQGEQAGGTGTVAAQAE